MQDIIVIIALIYFIGTVTVFFVMVNESEDIGNITAKTLFWPIYLIAKTTKAIIYDIKSGIKN